MSIDLSTLNENQRAAVLWSGGPLLVLAGPGSGKTRVLTYRIARLIEASPKASFKILGLTFTNKAAAEMRERIERMVPDASARTHLTTFHAFCADILRQHGSHIGLRPSFTILSQDDERAQLLDETIAAARKPDDELEIKGDKLLPLVNRLMDRCVLPTDAETLLEKQGIRNATALARIYRTYRQRMIDDNTLDFGALIAECMELLRSRPAIRKQVRRIYTHVCVDEFQDTNVAQYKVLRELAPTESGNLFVVGDGDQIIYQWNGASPERLNHLRRDYSCQEIHLPENYRCPPEVIQIANALISHNEGRTPVSQVPTKPASGSDVLRLETFSSFSDELRWIAMDIAARPDAERQRCSVLARTRKALGQLLPVLEAEGLVGYLPVRKDEFNSAPLVWLHAALRLANSRNDKEQLRRLCKAFYSLEGIDLNVADVISRSAIVEGDFMRAWIDALEARMADVSAPGRDVMNRGFRQLMDHLVVEGVVEGAFTWFDSLIASGAGEQQFDEYAQEREVFEDLVREIRAKYSDSVSLNTLLQELDLSSKAPPAPRGAIPLYTIHASKGLEFSHVYLIAMVEDQLPSWAAVKKGDASRELQEERRNCFVAITRAQESLTLTCSTKMYGYGKAPSRFLREMKLLDHVRAG